ncbi:MAG TPA: TonB-dependent receptor [Polyangiaceae bacterium]|nr:TonB-dependent receptor [Polyangiaceae bacterium]
MRKTSAMAGVLALSICANQGVVLAQSTSGPNETPTRQGKLTKPPKLVQFVEAPYPESEKLAGKMASVILQIAINDKGVVDDVAVVQSASPAFDLAALEAAKKFVFEPAEIDNRPSPVKITYKYDFVLKEEPVGPIINFEGVIRDRATKKAIEGLKVAVEGVGEAITDDEGHFEFEEVPDGKLTVTISGPGFTTITTEENLEEGKHLEVRYTVTPKEDKPGESDSDEEVVIVAPRIKKEVISTEIKVEEGKRVPGTQGDTLKVVQNLPGVARAAFGSGQLVVWGAAPQDTRVYVDGVRVPLLYHGGGLRSTINSDMVRAIDLAPGGYGSEFGRGLGGLVTVETRSPRADGFHGYVAADIIDASAMLEMPVSGSTRVAVAGRQSYLDRDLKLFTSKDVGDFVPIPTYYDAQLKIEHDLGQNESLQIFGLLSNDDLVRTVTNPDPAQTKREETHASFNRLIARYRRQFDDGSSVTLTPSIGTDHQSTVARFGGSPTSLDNKGTAYGLRATYRSKIAPSISVLAGLDIEAQTASLSRQGSVTLPAREGDIHVFGQQPGDQTNVDAWTTTMASLAPYAQLDIALFGDKLHVIPGVRLEPYLTGGNRLVPVAADRPSTGFMNQDTAVDPRLAIRWQATPRASMKAAFGIYHQAPLAEDLSSVFGNPMLGISSARHALAGGTVKFTDLLSLELVGFYSKSNDLVSRSALTTPGLAQALLQEGEGRAYGGQLLLRHELSKGFFGWASYSLIRSERKDHPGREWRLFDFDQTHVATVVASYELGLGFEVGARFRYASGFPRTSVPAAFTSLRRDLDEPFFGKQNAVRIPDFVQADVRVAKRFTFGTTKAEVYLDVQNVTNRRNPEDIIYNYNYSQQGYITGLPILPVVGARIEW